MVLRPATPATLRGRAPGDRWNLRHRRFGAPRLTSSRVAGVRLF